MGDGGVEIQRTLEAVEAQIETIGDEVVDTKTAEVDGTTKAVGLVAEHGNWTYIVDVIKNEHHRVQIKFPFSIISNVSNVLDEETASEIASGTDLPDDIDDEVAAAFEILSSIRPHKMDQFRQHLIDRISTTDAAYSIREEENVVVGFDVVREFYPLDESGTVTEFSHSVQTVVSSGSAGVRFCNMAFDFESAVDEFTGEAEDLAYIQ